MNRFLILIGVLVWMPAMSAAVFNAEGVAPVGASVIAARQQALQDALQQIALQQGAQINSTQVLDDQGRLNESGRLMPMVPLSKDVQIIDEFQQNSLYHIKATLQQKALQTSAGAHSNLVLPKTSKAASYLPGCAMPQGHVLRRKVVTTYFTVEKPADASDLPRLATDIPTDLARRLNQNVHFSVSHADRLLVPSQDANPNEARNFIRQLGQREDAQFVLAGRIISTAVTAKGLRRIVFESSQTAPQGVYYDGPLSGMFNSGLQYVPTQRQFDLMLWVYDGLTGAVLGQHRIYQEATGQVMQNTAFASGHFWRTPYGQAIDQALNQAVLNIERDVQCIPFVARVLNMADDKVYLNAGARSGLKVGDKLLIYKPNTMLNIRSFPGGHELGEPEMLIGEITLTQLQPGFAIGVVHTSTNSVEPGDYARFMPSY